MGKKRLTEYFAANPEKREAKRKLDREYQRERRKNNKGLKTKEYAVYRAKYPDKVFAQQKLNYELNKGRIRRKRCEFVIAGLNKLCGLKKVHAHHPDYKYPLTVLWFCPVHHKLIHPCTK